jgi:hypothetical protein
MTLGNARVVFNFARNHNRTDRHKMRRGKCAARRPLANRAVAISYRDRIRLAFVTSRSAGETYDHPEFLSELGV